MATPPDYVFPVPGDESAAGESYYSGNKVFTSDGDDETWTVANKPTDQTTFATIEERLEAIEQALNL